MTGVDVIVAIFFAFCVASEPVEITQDGNLYAVTIYECPLIREPPTFYLWRHVCSDRVTQHGVALWGDDKRGFTVNRFGEIQPAYVDAERMAVYFPACP